MRKVKFDFLEVMHTMKVMLKFVWVVSGEWFVNMDGIPVMLKWFADSWDSQMLVRKERGRECKREGNKKRRGLYNKT